MTSAASSLTRPQPCRNVIGTCTAVCSARPRYLRAAFAAYSFLSAGAVISHNEQSCDSDKASCNLAILAIGMTFVILTGGIDLSVGSVAGLGGMVVGYVLTQGISSLAR